jgi:hypothetical protein
MGRYLPGTSIELLRKSHRNGENQENKTGVGHEVTRYKISQNQVGHIQISVRYDHIGQIISARIKFILLNITQK